MRKFCLFLCCMLLIQMLCACGGKTESFEEPVNFYYTKEEISYNSSDGAIQAEVQEGAELHGNLTAFLHAYLRGPQSTNFKRTIPKDVYLVSCEINDEFVEIVFSKQFSNLSGIDLVCACSALLLSVHDFTGVDSLHIIAKNALIEEKEVYVITMDDIVLMDTVTIED